MPSWSDWPCSASPTARSRGSSSPTRFPAGERCKPIENKLVVLSVGELLGEAIGRIHDNTSISALFEGTVGVKR
jgi:hypothetical protein